MKKLNLIKKTGCCCSTIDINEDDIPFSSVEAVINLMCAIDVGEFSDKAIYLPDCYNYVVGEDSKGNAILVPLKKK